MRNDQDRFGIPLSNLVAAAKWCEAHQHGTCHVPTRKEVANLPATKISSMLITWMCDCPPEITPSRAQISEVAHILGARQDAAELSTLIAMCNRYANSD